MKTASLCGVAILLGACAATSTPQPKSVVQQRPEAFARRPNNDAFITNYGQVAEADAQPLRAAGLAEELLAVRSYVVADLPPGNEALVASSAKVAILRQARVSSTANFLIRIGYRGKHFANRAQGSKLVRAAAGALVGGTAADIAIIAPTVAVADLINVEDMPDGAVNLVYRVVEPLKMAPPAGTEIRLLLHGARSPSAPFPGEDEMRANKRVVLLLQAPETVIVPPGDPAAVLYARITRPMSVTGDTLFHSDVPETTLTKLRAAIREQICSAGYVPAAQHGQSSLRC